MISNIKLLSIIPLFSFFSCGNYNAILKEDSKIVKKQYDLLLSESNNFLSQSQQVNFIASLNDYILNCKEYNFQNGREPAVSLNPIIVNKNHTKAIIFVLRRGIGISGERIEFVKLISAKYSYNEWHFKLRTGHGYSFSYSSSDYESLTEIQIAIEGIRNLMLENYFKNGIIHDSTLFESNWFVLK